MYGTLFIVGTPIGNIRDITLRAIETLKSVDLIACEDTRHTKILLDKHLIKTRTTSYHKFNIKQKTNSIIDLIRHGSDVALVSDAGMPGISDPGQELIKAATEAGIKVEIVPGPSAAISALSVSGMGIGRFVFEGFLPVGTSDRKDRLQALAKEERAIILYEAPHRLVKTLEDLMQYLGDRNICIARELTKKFEEVMNGQISQFVEKFSHSKPRGEFALVVEGDKMSGAALHDQENDRQKAELLVSDLVKAGMHRSSAAKIVSKRLNTPKNSLYRAALGN